MRRNNTLFWIAIGITVCGGAFLAAQLFTPRALEICARVMLAAGCIAMISSAVFGNRSASPAYSGFGKAALKASAGSITFGDVAANMNAKDSLNGIVDYLKNTEKYKRFGARMPRGVILYGPPGTGKTLLARALAGEAGVPFFALSGSDFVQMYVGVGASRIRELFSNARKAGKCVIFIDEIDALGRRRSDAASEERDQTLNALLSEMSGFRGDEGIVVLAATNRLETLDPALLRPGRFDRQIEVGLPGRDERLDILNLHSRNKPMACDVDLEQLAGDTSAFSGAALEALLNEAAILAAQRMSESIEKADIDSAFYRTIAGPDGTHAVDPEERCAVALHEAGHAIALKQLMPENRLKRISILSAGRGAAGYNLAIPKERVLLKKQDIEAQITVLLAGRAAELLIGGEDALTSGASGDLTRAAELVSSMIMDLGMGGEPAIAVRTLGAVCGGARSAEEICREKLKQMYDRATSILEANIESLIMLTDVLLEKETLDEREIDAVLNTVLSTKEVQN